ncbi:S-adenosyl-L-methionine-dependent methyltransferase [Xylariomycetidae sp. FL2044]|nr:S-adenosyl-L-methionine-dependent methyltransferase [Xylariomycetidae sp. FL2044]
MSQENIARKSQGTAGDSTRSLTAQSRDTSSSTSSRVQFANAEISRLTSVSSARGHWPPEDSDDEDESSDETSGTARGAKRTKSRAGKLFRNALSSFNRSRPKNRTFQGYYKEGIFLNNPKEKDRIEMQHRSIVEIWEGLLYLCPLEVPATVLDVGTGSGIWALDFASKNPQSKVLGVDIEPIRPAKKLPNCTFKSMDITLPWTLGASRFDLIHVRMLGDLAAPVREEAFRSMYAHLNPGGWIECTEWVMRLRSGNNSTRGTRLDEWFRGVEKGLRIYGGSVDYVREWGKLMKAQGFQGVTEWKIPVPLNTWPPSKRLKKIGAMMTFNAQAFLDTVSEPILGQGLSWSQEDIDQLISESAKEIPDPSYHGYFDLFTIYGQKPFGTSF